MFLAPRFVVSVALLSLACSCGPGTAPFERVEMTAPALGLFGAGKTDVWGQVTTGAITTLAHSSTLKQWSAVSLAAEGSMVEPTLVSTANAGANLAWVITADATGARQLLQVSAKGVSEDHTSELPTGVSPLQVSTSAKGDALWVVGTSGSGQTTRAQLFVRQGGALVEQTALPAALEVHVLAVVSTDEAWVWWASAPGGPSKPRAYHVKGGVFTDATWPTDSAPKVAQGPGGEAWLWRSSGSESVSGLHFDGTSFTPWTTQNWPVQASGMSTVSHFAFAMLAQSAGKASLLTHATDFSATKETERDSFRVVQVDPSGQVTLGPTLATCLTANECAAGDAAVLGDGTVVIPATEANVIYRGDASAIP